MGHYCWVCGRTRANEKFSGKGHARHICKDCQRLPREERDRVQALRDIDAFMDQRNISAKNVARLKTLCRSSSEEGGVVAQLLVLGGAGHRPHVDLAPQRLEVPDAQVDLDLVLLLPAKSSMNHQVLMAMDVSEDGDDP